MEWTILDLLYFSSHAATSSGETRRLDRSMYPFSLSARRTIAGPRADLDELGHRADASAKVRRGDHPLDVVVLQQLDVRAHLADGLDLHHHHLVHLRELRLGHAAVAVHLGRILREGMAPARSERAIVSDETGLLKQPYALNRAGFGRAGGRRRGTTRRDGSRHDRERDRARGRPRPRHSTRRWQAHASWPMRSCPLLFSGRRASGRAEATARSPTARESSRRFGRSTLARESSSVGRRDLTLRTRVAICG